MFPFIFRRQKRMQGSTTARDRYKQGDKGIFVSITNSSVFITVNYYYVFLMAFHSAIPMHNTCHYVLLDIVLFALLLYPCSSNGNIISPAIQKLQERFTLGKHNNLLLIQQFVNLSQLHQIHWPICYYYQPWQQINIFLFTVTSYPL